LLTGAQTLLGPQSVEKAPKSDFGAPGNLKVPWDAFQQGEVGLGEVPASFMPSTS